MGNLKNFCAVPFLLIIAAGGLHGGEPSPTSSLSSGYAGLDSRAESDPMVSTSLYGGRAMFRDEYGPDRVTAHLSLPGELPPNWNTPVPAEPRQRSAFAKIMIVVSYVSFPFFLIMGCATHLAMRAKSRRAILGDFVGIGQLEDELKEIVEFLRDPRKFSRFNDEPPKGVLMVNPYFKALYARPKYARPKIGKIRIAMPLSNSMLARAIAHEAGVPFFRITNPGFPKNLLGSRDKQVHDIFERARTNAPCIVYIDDIAEFGRASAKNYGFGNDRRRRKLNRILAEMRAFEADEGILAFAATDRPEALDPALLSPGRFDRQMKVPSYRFKLRPRYAILAMLALIAFLLPFISIYYNCTNADAPFFTADAPSCSIFR